VKLVVHAPATVANLGPGFDCLGLALDLTNEFTLDTEANPGIDVQGQGAGDGEMASSRANLVVRAIELAFAAAGRDAPPFHLGCVNRIPLRRGLGSSATATVAGGIFAAELLGRPREPEGLLTDAFTLEGHADNAAACLLGGLTIAYRDDQGQAWRAVRLECSPVLRPVVLVPEEEEVETASGRAVLPQQVPLADAVFNLSRSALAVHALTLRPDLLRDAMADRLHQRRRLTLAPGAAAMFDWIASQGIPVCVAGSGPSLLVFEEEGRTVPEPPKGWRVLRLGIAKSGATLSAVT
jgi:homoserine kinase